MRTSPFIAAATLAATLGTIVPEATYAAPAPRTAPAPAAVSCGPQSALLVPPPTSAADCALIAGSDQATLDTVSHRRRYRTRTRYVYVRDRHGWKHKVAVVGGSALAGGLIGGKKGAVVGGLGGALWEKIRH